jgi:hypothetical protein
MPTCITLIISILKEKADGRFSQPGKGFTKLIHLSVILYAVQVRCHTRDYFHIKDAFLQVVFESPEHIPDLIQFDQGFYRREAVDIQLG